MHLVTKCPSCFTSFVVKPEQLNQHHGQVRCGQCQKVFVAAEHVNSPIAPKNLLETLRNLTPLNKKNLALNVFLVVLALTQILFFLRGDFAKRWPNLKPTIVTACKHLGCKIPLPQHAELITLDDTELIKDETRNDVIKFNGIIINNAPYAQSFPSLELTLTDDHDIPVMRRKIIPAEYLKGLNANLDEGLSGNDEIHISINLKTTDIPATGFRAFIVY